MERANVPYDPRGSVWRRWDPHLHTPGTVLNNQFGGDATVWDDYLERLERSDPRIVALGVTDYCLVDCYERVRELKDKGRLPDVDLISRM